jgi:Ice-binding-like
VCNFEQTVDNVLCTFEELGYPERWPTFPQVLEIGGIMRLRRFCLSALTVLILPFFAVSAYADTILGSNLSTFAILGGGGVTIGGTGSVITGSVGAYPTTSITGVIPTNFTLSGGTVQSGGATAAAGQLALAAAISALSGMTSNQTVSSLGGLTLGPGVYSSSSTMDLTGTLTLDGGGNANALWVFQIGSAFSTASSNSVVNVINTGAGAGVYWVLATGSGSATLGSNSTFAGNILANQSISLGTNVTDPCGRLLTQVASVTLAGTDTVGIDCSGILAGSNGLSGGGTLGGGTVTPLPSSAVPEPGTLVLFGSGIPWLAIRMRRALARR